MRLRFFIFFLAYSFLWGCNNKADLRSKFKINIDKIAIDTLDGMELAFRIVIDNNSNKIIEFYTGLGQSETQAEDGFFIHFKGINKSFQMTSMLEPPIAIVPANKTNNKFIVDVCFREYCKDISAFGTIADTYYKSKSKLENIQNLIKDISIEYRVNKTWDDNNYLSVFKNDSIIYFNRLDTIETKFFTEITGATFDQMLKK